MTPTWRVRGPGRGADGSSDHRCPSEGVGTMGAPGRPDFIDLLGGRWVTFVIVKSMNR